MPVPSGVHLHHQAKACWNSSFSPLALSPAVLLESPLNSKKLITGNLGSYINSPIIK